MVILPFAPTIPRGVLIYIYTKTLGYYSVGLRKMRHWVCEANAAIFFIEPDFWENSKGVLFGKKKGTRYEGGTNQT